MKHPAISREKARDAGRLRPVERDTVVLVDAADRVIGRQDKLEAHRRGTLHSAFSVFIFRYSRGRLELLLQKRASGKYHCAGRWSNSCCSHPGPLQSLSDSAADRLDDELGFRVPLHWRGRHAYRAELDNGLIEHEIDHLFVGWHRDEDIEPHPAEVEDVLWAPVNELPEKLARGGEAFTPWFAGTLACVLSRLSTETGQRGLWSGSRG